MEIEKINYEEFEQTFVDRALCKIRKLRRILVFKLGIPLWKDISIQDAMHQITKEEAVLKSHEEIMEYCTKLAEEKMNMDMPLWEFRIVENYTSNTSLIIYRTHHCFMDGVGFASLMSVINDNQFASKLNRKVVQPSTMEGIKLAAKFPMVLNKLGAETGEWCSDEKAKKIAETN